MSLSRRLEKSSVAECADSSGRLSSHNRLIVATLPHRHDLPSTHDINQHTALVNAYIEELAARHHISVLDMNRLQRKHFTRHGMHLHTRGKWQLASEGRREGRSKKRPCCPFCSFKFTRAKN
ncbi:hypothetical protein J6590_047435 [Homalodisca vitripennis]|nr:hypothetical protein J6590_047435 [Homalodisca vitripennis]